MTKEDFEAFSEAWASAWELCGKEPTERAVVTAYDALQPYELKNITAAITAHIRDPDAGRFPPKPADIIGKMIVDDGRPGPEEAWAMCPTSERETAWMTHEMRIAQASANPLIDRGDTIAARKAFLEVYGLAIKQARIIGEPCYWSKSIGWDAESRESPSNENLAQKYLERINHTHVMLPAP